MYAYTDAYSIFNMPRKLEPSVHVNTKKTLITFFVLIYITPVMI